ncbi:MAG: monovalent cation/H(+) antiporter subunit G [Candidatus Acidiferrales bacterium]
MNELVSATLALIGAVFVLLAAVGMVRMPDLFTRLQATSKAATLGVGCLMAAIAVHFGDLGITTRAMAVVLFTFLTAPVAAHMIARVAYFIGEPLWKGTVVDELRGCYDQRTNVCRSAPVEGGGAAARAVPTNNS